MGLPKAKVENQNKNKKQNRLKNEVILESILQNEYVLVIGSEAILKTDLEGTDKSGDSNVLLYNAILQDKEIDYGDDKSWSEKQWQNFFRERCIHKDSLAKVEATMRENGDYKFEDISKELDLLIRTKYFPFVITTSVDGYLELLMRDVWGDKLQIVNFKDKSSLNKFYDTISALQRGILYTMPPTLLYAFGRVNYCSDGVTRTPFVFTEDDSIITISDWLRIAKNEPKLFEFINQKSIMAIGCKFNDWRFRFFWYSLCQDINGLGIGTGNTVAITIKDTDDKSYTDLLHYLINEEVHVETDSRKFMRDIVNLLNPDPSSDLAKVFESVLQRGRNLNGLIFISYPHEDFSIVFQIYSYLIKSGYNVWLDYEKLYSGDEYENAIKIALEECDIFMPILSEQVGEDLSCKDCDRFYLNKEWQKIKERKSLKKVDVIPIALSEYNIAESYHKESFCDFWGIDKDGENNITIEYVENIEHIKQKLDKILKYGNRN